MLTLIAGVVGIVVLLGSIAGFDHWRQGVGREKQIEHDRPVMALCEQFPAKGLFGGPKAANPAECGKGLRDALALGQQAEEANASLQLDLTRLDMERKSCSADVLRLERQGKRAKEETDKRKPGDDRQLALLSAEKQALVDALNRADSKSGTCEQRLARRDALWAGMATQRQRDFPPGSSPPQSGDVNIRSPK